MNTLLKQFVEETREFLEDAASGLLALEKNPEDSDAMGRVFRAMHSTKGGSGLFDFDPMTDLVHEAENLLDEVRNGERAMSATLADQLLDVLDQVTAWIDAIERDEVLPSDAQQRSDAQVTALRQAADGGAAAAAPVAPDLPEAPVEPLAHGDTADVAVPEWLQAVPDPERRELAQRLLQQQASVTAFEFTPDSGVFFSGGDPLLLVRDLEDLAWLDIAPRESWTDLENFDPYDCRLRFRGLVAAEPEAVADAFAFEDEETFRCLRLPPEALVFPAGEPGDAALLEEFLVAAPEDFARGDMDALRRGAEAMGRMLSTDTREGSVLAWLRLVIDAGRGDLSAPLLRELGADVHAAPAQSEPAATSAAPAQPAAAAEPQPAAGVDQRAVLAVMQEQLAMLGASDPAAADAAGRVAAAGRVVQRGLLALGRSTDGLEDALVEAGRGELGGLRGLIEAGSGGEPVAPAEAGVPGGSEGGGERVAKSFRVDAESIDLLGDLVGELVVAKNSFPFLAERAERQYGVRDLARELKDRFNVISRIAQDMQSAVMQVQMLPMQQIFQRFPRLVRDLSRRLEKDVELVLEGEQTEADKTVIEVLGEPLTHMVRNSIDHGIELPAQREAAGKAPRGTIRLAARQEGENVIIEVEDDGGGLDPEAIRRKAVSKELISEDEAQRLSDQDSLQLIFAPGFSTRDAVSDLSGRGVGMDVVRSTVHRYGGAVSVASEMGRGTRLRLSMPLTMAVSYVMGVEVAGQLFGVPMENIVETVRLPQSAVRRVKQDEAVVLRDQVVPLRRLDRLLMLEAEASERRTRVDANYDEPQVSVLVVRHKDGPLGLVVDDFQEGLDVIVKPMEGVLASIRAYAGTALLGDGRVLLVLNLRELL